MKNRLCAIIFLLIVLASCDSSGLQPGETKQVADSAAPQVLPLDTTASDMPVLKTDTGLQKPMPIVEPPANIEHK